MAASWMKVGAPEWAWVCTFLKGCRISFPAATNPIL
jgi:hypothetical protein